MLTPGAIDRVGIFNSCADENATEQNTNVKIMIANNVQIQYGPTTLHSFFYAD